MPFGGAGPTQANLIVDAAGLSRMIVPARPGTFCALGAIMADVKRDYVRSAHFDLSGDMQAPGKIAELVRAMAAEAQDWIADEGDILKGHDIAVSLDMRYRGQAFDLAVPCQWDGESIDAPAAIEGFHRAHERLYHFRDTETAVEITTIRLKVTGHVEPVNISAAPLGGQPAAGGESRTIYWKGSAHRAEVLSRDSLGVGAAFHGPAILEQEDTTVVVLPGWHGHVDMAGNLIVEKKVTIPSHSGPAHSGPALEN